MLTANFKKTALFALSIAISTTVFAQNFHLQVKLKNLDRCKVQLSYPANQQYIVDTGKRSGDGTISFVGNLSAPVIAHLNVIKPELNIRYGNGIVVPPDLEFVLSDEDIQIDGDADSIYASTVSGKSNLAWSAIREEEARLTRNWWYALKSMYDNKSDSAEQRLDNVKTIRDQKIEDIRKKNIRDNPAAFSSAYFLYLMEDQLTPGTLEALFLHFDEQVKQSIFGNAVNQKILKKKLTANGAPALPINKKDIKGHLVDLNDFKGKYILLDFWGSWCPPCRASHPRLVELYNKYRSKGFEIIGIAKERDEDGLIANEKNWKAAIEADKLPWIQVLNNWDQQKNDVVKAYGITAFPSKILIDTKGMIISSYTNSDDGGLEKKLDQIFNSY